jgi:hypothetical protein
MQLSPFLRGTLANCAIALAPAVQRTMSVQSGLRLPARSFDAGYYSTKLESDSVPISAPGFQIGVISFRQSIQVPVNKPEASVTKDRQPRINWLVNRKKTGCTG